ncbi:uncharacterized protein LOC129554760 [Moschus berezovskii]|uniref:uncharacterized protein LOC129554760 n=1 Tax=Moschus berezovskii TaxID=68408 RepID=UPI0024442C01|nr:uncharacterized protein LOC129554760 [Moschus berezovskii]
MGLGSASLLQGISHAFLIHWGSWIKHCQFLQEKQYLNRSLHLLESPNRTFLGTHDQNMPLSKAAPFVAPETWNLCTKGALLIRCACQDNGSVVFHRCFNMQQKENQSLGDPHSSAQNTDILLLTAKTRDLFKKIRDIKGTFHAKMGSIKDRNGMDLTEAEDIKKRWQEYTEELYKKDLHDEDNHDGVITHLEPDILECVVKWALESITMNKASGGDGIPVELFQILKDDAVKVLHSICQQIWKTQQWPQDWKRTVFIPIPKKGNAKECSNYHTIALISHASKVMLKILQARLQQYVNRELPDVQAGFRKGRGTRDQIANIRWIMEKAREFQKNIYFCFIDYAKAFDCVDHNKLENSERDGNPRPPDLPLEKPVCRSGSNS